MFTYSHLGITARTAPTGATSSWQLTILGEESLESCLQVVGCKKLHWQRRQRDVQLSQMSAWELVAHLESKGWQGRVWTQRARLPDPLDVKKGAPKLWWVRHSSNNLSRAYLLALAMMKDIAPNVPHGRLDHCKPDKYYSRLLKRPKQFNLEADCGVDACIGSPRKRHRKGKRARGEAHGRQRAKSRAVAKEVRAPRRRSERTYSWGGGLMIFKPRVLAWQATCPRCKSHRNPRQAKTKCTKTMSYTAGSEESDLRRLKLWLNAAMEYDSRLAHMQYRVDRVPESEVPSDDDLLAGMMDSEYESEGGGAAAPAAEEGQPTKRRRIRHKRGSDGTAHAGGCCGIEQRSCAARR